MEDRTSFWGVAGVMVTPIVEFYQSLLPFFLVAVVCIVVDCRFGVEAARRRGETIRHSRMFRRSIGKMVDYFSWITLAGVFGLAFGEVMGIPTLSVLMLLVVVGIEMMSIFNNYFEARGIKKRFSLKGFLRFFNDKLDDIVVEDGGDQQGADTDH